MEWVRLGVAMACTC